MIPTTDLLVRLSPRPTGTALVCVPPAGAGAGFFTAWPPLVPAHLELWAVRLPGRETSFGRPPCTDLEAAADLVLG